MVVGMANRCFSFVEAHPNRQQIIEQAFHMVSDIEAEVTASKIKERQQAVDQMVQNLAPYFSF